MSGKSLDEGRKRTSRDLAFLVENELVSIRLLEDLALDLFEPLPSEWAALPAALSSDIDGWFLGPSVWSGVVARVEVWEMTPYSESLSAGTCSCFRRSRRSCPRTEKKAGSRLR